MRALCLFLIAILTILILSLPASASNPFSVSGNVTDAEGIPLPHAGVMLLDASNRSVITTYTDADGHYTLGNVSRDTPKIRILVSYLTPTGKDVYILQSAWHEASDRIIIPDNETRFTNYTLPGKGYIYGYILRESDHMLMTGTVYLNNGKTREVTDPLQPYLFEVGPGNYSVFAVHYEDGKKLVSDRVEVQALPAENKNEVPAVDLLVKPEIVLNFGALALALALGLAGILALYLALRKAL